MAQPNGDTMTDPHHKPLFSLSHAKAVVTGAQQGIGLAIAVALAQAGASIVANYLDDDTAASGMQTLSAMGARVTWVKADLSDSGQIAHLFEQADALGGLDILVNNAAIFPRADFLELTEAMWDQTLAVNLKAPFLCTQQAARRMIAQGRGGSIINITSGAAFRSSPRAAHYVSSKAGLVGLTRASAMALASHQIRVNAVAPGITDTAQPRQGMSEDDIFAAAALVPLGRIASASDIAPTVQFLASDGAAHVTGQTWHVNGGQYLA
jgi:3-oxoacyl-[acyl-carrier protein] reductase